mmetsp:Transcript_11797/g.38771  ORF Transcript_11797/g.38771 Transcript_11797/m.38771 type:complete len:555 (+) Transcript_11797:1311-2975(+)
MDREADGHARVGNLDEGFRQKERHGRVETAGRFVEHEHLGLRNNRTRNCDTAALTAREALNLADAGHAAHEGGLLVKQRHHVQCFVYKAVELRLARHRELEPAVEANHLLGAHVGAHDGVLHHETELLAWNQCLVTLNHVVILLLDRSGKDAEKRRFASPGRTHDGANASLENLSGETLENRLVALFGLDRVLEILPRHNSELGSGRRRGIERASGGTRVASGDERNLLHLLFFGSRFHVCGARAEQAVEPPVRVDSNEHLRKRTVDGNAGEEHPDGPGVVCCFVRHVHLGLCHHQHFVRPVNWVDFIRLAEPIFHVALVAQEPAKRQVDEHDNIVKNEGANRLEEDAERNVSNQEGEGPRQHEHRIAIQPQPDARDSPRNHAEQALQEKRRQPSHDEVGEHQREHVLAQRAQPTLRKRLADCTETSQRLETRNRSGGHHEHEETHKEVRGELSVGVPVDEREDLHNLQEGHHHPLWREEFVREERAQENHGALGPTRLARNSQRSTVAFEPSPFLHVLRNVEEIVLLLLKRDHLLRRLDGRVRHVIHSKVAHR